MDAFHVARSNFIDAFGEVEAAICKRLINFDKDPGNQQLGQKIAMLREMKASPRYSKLDRQRINGALERLQAFQEIRCDVVHAPMKLVEMDGIATGCFVNPRNLQDRTILARHITLEKFEQLTREVASIAAELA